ncbi:MAG: 4-demethylwyosine synthase TYW1 [Candidatus Aenigmatarchaeota archaeon]
MEQIINYDDIKRLEKAGFRFIGKHKHSAIKICEWTRKAIRGDNFCYKQKFYGINSHRCLQMTPAFQFCTHRCLFCWRDISITYPKWNCPIDEPKQILDEAIKAQQKILQGFGGNIKVTKKRFNEAMNPNQVAISLAGEPTLYPKLPELIDEIKMRNMTSFLVSNGTKPDMIKRLLNHQPNQLYITLPAPNEKVYKQTCQPLIEDGWERIMKTLSLLKKFSCNTVIRLTLVKGINFIDPEGYAKIILDASPKYIEVKSFMSVGFARQRLPYSAMPLHNEIIKFAEEIERAINYKIIDEKRDSRVVLLIKK